MFTAIHMNIISSEQRVEKKQNTLLNETQKKELKVLDNILYLINNEVYKKITKTSELKEDTKDELKELTEDTIDDDDDIELQEDTNDELKKSQEDTKDTYKEIQGFRIDNNIELQEHLRNEHIELQEYMEKISQTFNTLDALKNRTHERANRRADYDDDENFNKLCNDNNIEIQKLITNNN